MWSGSDVEKVLAHGLFQERCQLLAHFGADLRSKDLLDEELRWGLEPLALDLIQERFELVYRC